MEAPPVAIAPSEGEREAKNIGESQEVNFGRANAYSNTEVVAYTDEKVLEADNSPKIRRNGMVAELSLQYKENGEEDEQLVKEWQQKAAQATGGMEVGVNAIFDKMLRFLESKRLRFKDLFRSVTRHASNMEEKVNRLDANEVCGILWQAGLQLSLPEVNDILCHTDLQGKCRFNLTLMQDALDARQRENEAMLQPSYEPGTWPAEVLQAIQGLMTVERLRLSDLVRSPYYNEGYAEHKDEGLDAEQFRKLVGKAGLDITAQDSQAIVEFLDAYGDGTVTIDDLRPALSAHRRGAEAATVEEWHVRARQRSTSPTALSPRSPSPRGGISARITELHLHHQQNLKKRDCERMAMETREAAALKAEMDRARMGTRAKIRASDLSPDDFLYRQAKVKHEQEMNLERLKQRFQVEEAVKIDSTRFNPCAQSPQALTRDAQDAGHRLHSLHRDIMDKKRQRELDASAKTVETCPPQRMEDWQVTTMIGERMWKTAQEREERLKGMRKVLLEREEAMHKSSSPRGREVDMERIQDRVETYRKTQKAREEERLQAPDQEMKRAHEEYLKGAKKRQRSTPTELRQMPARVYDSSRSPSPRSAAHERARHPIAFGTRSPVARPTQASQLSSSRVEPGDVALAAVIAQVSLRCGCSPEDAPFELLREVSGSLNQVLGRFRQAAKDSDKDGLALALRSERSQRLYASGFLMEDVKGWEKLVEPDPIRQLSDKLYSLMHTADLAQRQLMCYFGPNKPTSLQEPDVYTRWPQGCKWNNPRTVRECKFAYNPGPKSKAAAEAKACVRFAPAARDKCYIHLLDLARIGLVFENADQVSNAVDQLRSNFEVAQIRNYYNPSLQNHLGERWVEVLIVLEEGLDMPHICEIRLEEERFFNAREETKELVDEICKGFREMFCHTETETTVEYLARWALRRPKENHSMSRFRRKLAGRFGSAVSLWRRTLANKSTFDFFSFRSACQSMHCHEQVVEYWEALDAGVGGCISLFELDPEAVVLLARLRSALLTLSAPDPEAAALVDATAASACPPGGGGTSAGGNLGDFDGNMLAKIALLSGMDLRNQGQMEVTEFRTMCRRLGFSSADADRLFLCLDSKGGSSLAPPAVVTTTDIAWLKKLPALVHLDAVLLTGAASVSSSGLAPLAGGFFVAMKTQLWDYTRPWRPSQIHRLRPLRAAAAAASSSSSSAISSPATAAAAAALQLSAPGSRIQSPLQGASMDFERVISSKEPDSPPTALPAPASPAPASPPVSEFEPSPGPEPDPDSIRGHSGSSGEIAGASPKKRAETSSSQGSVEGADDPFAWAKDKPQPKLSIKGTITRLELDKLQDMVIKRPNALSQSNSTISQDSRPTTGVEVAAKKRPSMERRASSPKSRAAAQAASPVGARATAAATTAGQSRGAAGQRKDSRSGDRQVAHPALKKAASEGVGADERVAVAPADEGQQVGAAKTSQEPQEALTVDDEETF